MCQRRGRARASQHQAALAEAEAVHDSIVMNEPSLHPSSPQSLPPPPLLPSTPSLRSPDASNGQRAGGPERTAGPRTGACGPGPVRGSARFDTTIVRTLRARLSVGRSARPRAADVQARRSDERLARDMQRYSLSNHRQAKSRETCNVIHYQTIGKRKIPFRDRPSLIDGRRLHWNFEIGS